MKTIKFISKNGKSKKNYSLSILFTDLINKKRIYSITLGKIFDHIKMNKQCLIRTILSIPV